MVDITPSSPSLDQDGMERYIAIRGDLLYLELLHSYPMVEPSGAALIGGLSPTLFMTEREMPKKLLIRKLKEHDGIIKCPYCKAPFDVHLGMIFLEGKDIPGASPEYCYEHFEEIMAAPERAPDTQKPICRCKKCGNAFSIRPILNQETVSSYGERLQNMTCFKCGTGKFLTITEA